METGFFDATIFSIVAEQWTSVWPLFVLCIGAAITTITAGLRCSDSVQKILVSTSLIASGALFFRDLNEPAQFFLGSSLEIDPQTRLYSILVLICVFVGSLFVFSDEGDEHPEWGLLVLCLTIGMICLLGARNWVAFFVSLETLSIPSYLLVALRSRKDFALEAALKYLLMGSFASAFLLLGLALIYGFCGAFDYESLHGTLLSLSSQEKILVSVAVVVLLSSFAFKIALIPFHMWAPDVYQGAQSGVAAILGSATKIALFGAVLVSCERSGFFRLLLTGQFFTLFGSLSIIVGSLLAISQRKVKRMLAYSGIVHVGYISLVAARGEATLGVAGFYLIIYGLSFVGALAAVESFIQLFKMQSKDIDVEDLSEIATKAPKAATIAFAFFVFSLAGIPPLPGFFSKYLILKDLFGRGDFISLSFVLIGTFLGLGYYLRLMATMFFKTQAPSAPLKGAEFFALEPSGACRLSSWVSMMVAITSVAAIFLLGYFAAMGEVPLALLNSK